MKSLFDAVAANELKERFGKLRLNSERQWGKMSPAQMVAHCSSGLEMALGEIRPHRAGLMRILGALIKPKVIGGDEPFRRNSPTLPALLISGERHLEVELARLYALMARCAGGDSVCTEHPHPFFGVLTPAEWGVLMYKHLDHHLRQFGI